MAFHQHEPTRPDIRVRERRGRVPRMEGGIARWYTRLRSSGHQLETYRRQGVELTADLPDGADVLEIAPGPGFLAIEMARSRRVTVTGLDISHTFVQIASENARRAGVQAEFRQGDAAALPFDAASFDLIACQAAFKNFTRPVDALNEMHRVLRADGTAVIQDMRNEATRADIDREVRGMELGRPNAFMTKVTLTMLRRRAFSQAQFERLAAASAFGSSEIRADGIGIEVRLRKPDAA